MMRTMTMPMMSFRGVGSFTSRSCASRGPTSRKRLRRSWYKVAVRAIVLDTTVQLDTSKPAPAPAASEVLVRVTRAGVCETDLQLIKGYMGFRGVLGHEFVGVAESGDFAVRGVVGEINSACWQ